MNRTYKEIVDEMKALGPPPIGDEEAVHVKADELLLEYLRGVGAKDLVEAYEAISGEFWYA